MNDRYPEVLFDCELRMIRDEYVRRLEKLFAGEDDSDTAFILNGVPGYLEGARVGQDAASEVARVLAELAERAGELRDSLVFRPLVLENGLYGVHFIDKVFGAEVFDLDGTWQVNLLGQPVGNLEPPDLGRNPAWKKAQEIAGAFVESGVTVPFFGLPTIASTLNVAVNLYGQEFLVAMLDTPDDACRDMRVINEVLCEMHRWYRKVLPESQLQTVVGAFRAQPPGFGQLCGCTTQLISGDQYRELVAPFDAQLLAQYPHGGMIHLCGRHLQHVQAWQEMPELRAVQLNDRASEDTERYWKELREDQVLYVYPTPQMTVERIMDITNGRRVVIVEDVREVEKVLKRAGRIDMA